MAKFGEVLFIDSDVTDIETALYQTLISNVGVVAVLAARIYPMIAPQDVIGPFLVYERLTSELDYAQDGPSALKTARFRLTLGSGKYADVLAAYKVVYAAIQPSMSINQITTYGIFFNEPDDAYYQESNLHQRTVEFDVQYKLIQGD